MTSKVYRSAQGKSVDLGTIMLQNEHVRAVGNMKVNARGDKLDSNNRVIETKARQIQKQNDRTTTNVSSAPVHTSSKKARAARTNLETPAPETETVSAPDPVAPSAPEPEPVLAPAPVPEPLVTPVPLAPVNRIVAPATPAPEVAPVTPATPAPEVAPVTPPTVDAAPAPKVDAAPASGGLAGAIARSREIKQNLERTRRQQAQDKGVRKI